MRPMGKRRDESWVSANNTSGHYRFGVLQVTQKFSETNLNYAFHMATELFNRWCANHQHRANQLLSDMRAMGLAVESLAEVEQFTKIHFSPPGDIDGIFPQYLLDTLDSRIPIWENSNSHNGYLKKSHFKALWFGITVVVTLENATKITLTSLEMMRTAISNSTDLSLIPAEEIRDVVGPSRDLRRYELSDHDLSECDISGSKLPIHLHSVNLFRTNLRSVVGDTRITTYRQKVTGDWESESSLYGSEFSQCNLDYARLDKARLYGCRFVHCSAVASSWRNSFLESSNFVRTDLTHADFEGSDFSGASFHDVTFEDVNLRGCSFRGASLWNTRFGKYTNLEDADFLGANIYHVTREDEWGGIGTAIHARTVLPDGVISNHNADRLSTSDYMRFAQETFKGRD